MNKNDVILLAALLAVGIGALFLTRASRSEGTYVIVTVDGAEYGRYPIDIDKVIDINGTNTLEIKGGSARMTYADCVNQVCVNQSRVSRSGEMIVCVPNKIVITIIGDDSNTFDAVTQ